MQNFVQTQIDRALHESADIMGKAIKPKGLNAILENMNNAVNSIHLVENTQDVKPLTEDTSKDMINLMNDFAKSWTKHRTQIGKQDPEKGKKLFAIGKDLGDKMREGMRILKSK